MQIEDEIEDFDLESLGLEDDDDSPIVLGDDDEENEYINSVDKSGLFIPVPEDDDPVETVLEDQEDLPFEPDPEETKTKSEIAAEANTPTILVDGVESPVFPQTEEPIKQKRHRRTKAEIEAAKQAEQTETSEEEEPVSTEPVLKFNNLAPDQDSSVEPVYSIAPNSDIEEDEEELVDYPEGGFLDVIGNLINRGVLTPQEIYALGALYGSAQSAAQAANIAAQAASRSTGEVIIEFLTREE